MHTGLQWENLKEIDYLEELGVNGRMICVTIDMIKAQSPTNKDA
jgi:hypothetical protein